MCCSETKGRPAYIAKVPVQVPDWSIFYGNEESKFTLFGPNSTVLTDWNHIMIGHYGATVIGNDASEDRAAEPQWDRAGLSPLVEI